MYIPKHFALDDVPQAVAFMQKYSFATLVTAIGNHPEATHIPFITEQRGNDIILTSHFAKANPQAADIDQTEALVIFTEPHAYISPSHYEKLQNVPTWNYIAIHAYGKAIIIEDEAAQLQMMETMISTYDAPYLQQWDSMPIDYKQKLLKGIVAFEIRVTDLQGKQKLSQNRTEVERNNIVDTLSKSKDSVVRDLSDYMKFNH
ncbi:PaiB family negative transcriptional regulator [Mucilaginibacter yixingensis]|uniref:PaiB family negative transcriptional regulator n=1 Tax=Mucilaginibacter yixingensis TaxID=1295612 RepID=A0A2T5JA45_9SPHI|nr:FMN-binding negative transcriptional regulator [Mucilaginibacter yixingensis]PTQ96950.1 PaiB family negative transcriptional regulator [Mucilaginibacter yixingensis]